MVVANNHVLALEGPEGTDQMLAILTRAANGGATAADLERLSFLCEVATNASLCGRGQMAPNPITSALNQFEREFRGAFGEQKGKAKG